ncbi:hypothetical protein [Vibrio phage S4-7]|nr:hypothetical protein [Vibrio phage S4-7]
MLSYSLQIRHYTLTHYCIALMLNCYFKLKLYHVSTEELHLLKTSPHITIHGIKRIRRATTTNKLFT